MWYNLLVMSATGNEGCLFHSGNFDDDQKLIAGRLGRIVNAPLATLAEIIEGGAVDPESLTKLYIRDRDYGEVRFDGVTAHPYYFPLEERSPTITETDGFFSRCLEKDMDGVVDLADLHPVRLPVGYDRDFSNRSMRAMVGVLGALTNKELRAKVREVATDRDNGELLMRHTYQGMITRNPEDALQRIICGGIILAGQAEMYLTADPVAGFDTADDLSRAVAAAKLPSQFTANAGSGMLWTSVRHGRRVKNPVVRNDETGKPELSPKLVAYEELTRIDRQRQDEQNQIAHGYEEEDRTDPTHVEELTRRDHLEAFYGRGCPAAGKGVTSALKAIGYVREQLPAKH